MTSPVYRKCFIMGVVCIINSLRVVVVVVVVVVIVLVVVVVVVVAVLIDLALVLK